ncbi:unnamed protein product [Prunus armeniaca]
MLQGNVARHEGAEGKWDVEGTKLACRRAMCLGKGVSKAKGCRRRHKACVLQGNVARHGGAEGDTRLAFCKAMWLGTGLLKAQSLHVAGRCA